MERLVFALICDAAECDLHADKDWQITLQGNGTNCHEAGSAFSQVIWRLDNARESLGISAERYEQISVEATEYAGEMMADQYGEDWESQ